MPPCCRQLVDSNAAVGRRNTPFSLHKTFFEKALEGWIQRAFFDLKHVVRGPLNLLDERITVHGPSLQAPEDHHLQGTWKEVSLCRVFHVADRLPDQVQALLFKA